MTKVYIVGSTGRCEYSRMFLRQGWDVVHDITKADLMQFTGGEDVTPLLYGEPSHPRSYYNFERDLIESGYFAVAQLLHIPMAGICRGGQFLNVMNGGKMYQDVDNHAIRGTHSCVDRFTGERHEVTSTHHQMMRAAPHGEVIAVANLATHKEHMGQHKDHSIVINGVLGNDVEVVYYDKSKSLCFQPHPEFFGAGSTEKYYFELISRYLEL